MNPGVWTWLRPAVAALVVGLGMAVPAGAGAGGSTRAAPTALEASTIQSINVLRVSHGLAPLKPSNGLFGSAALECRQMVEGGYFSHDAPGGPSLTSRLASFYPPGRHEFYLVAENLLWTLTPMSGHQMVATWMKSPEHRANLLNPAWQQVAVAVLSVDSAPGVYGDEPVTVVTVDFGVRR